MVTQMLVEFASARLAKEHNAKLFIINDRCVADISCTHSQYLDFIFCNDVYSNLAINVKQIILFTLPVLSCINTYMENEIMKLRVCASYKHQ